MVAKDENRQYRWRMPFTEQEIHEAEIAAAHKRGLVEALLAVVNIKPRTMLDPRGVLLAIDAIQKLLESA